jgi:hypothetical protein
MALLPTGLAIRLLGCFLRDMERCCCCCCDCCNDDDGDGIGYSLLQKTVVDILGRVLVDAGAAVAAGRKEAVELEIIEALPLLLGYDGMGVATPVAPGVPTADGH